MKSQGCGPHLKKEVSADGATGIGEGSQEAGLEAAEQLSEGAWRKRAIPEGEDRGAGYFTLLRACCANSSRCLETSVMSDIHILGPVEFHRMKMRLVKGHVTQKRISMCLK